MSRPLLSNIGPLRCCGRAVLVPLLAGVLLLTGGARAEESRQATLRLQGGGRITGEWLDAEDGRIVRWNHNAFTRPFEFPDTAVESITYGGVDLTEKPQGAFAVDFFNGDRIYGDWVGGNDELFRFDCQRWGKISVKRDTIRRISRWNDGEYLIYNGPHSLDDWDEPADAQPPAWSMSGTRLITDAADREIICACGLEPQSTIYLELEWIGAPNFIVALGVDAEQPDDRGAARLEVWDGQLVLLRELANKADVTSVQSVGKESGSLKLTVFLDQPAGEAVVVSATGEKLAEISLPHPDGEAVITSETGERLAGVSVPSLPAKMNSSIRFKNVRGELQIRRLLVLRGQDQSMMQGASSEERVIKTDGQTLVGNVESVDGDSQAVKVTSDADPVSVPLTEVDSWYGPAVDDGEDSDATDAGTLVRLAAYDSTQISGALQRVAERQVWIQSAMIDEPLSLSLDQLQSLATVAPSEPSFDELPGRSGRLEMDGLSLRGALVGEGNQTATDEETPDAGSGASATLSWQARGAAKSVGLVDGVSGRIVYRDPPPAEEKPTPQQVRQQRAQRPRGFIGGLGAFFSGEVVMPEASSRGVTLRTGDTVTARIDRIDSEGVSILAAKKETSHVKHEHIKAVDLVTGSAMDIEAEKRTRLLTVPRMLRNDPFTHIIVSTNDDFLRGRLISMDEKSLRFETRLREMTIPRRLVARIIWLHPTPSDVAQQPAKELPTDDPAQAENALRVQAVRSDGTRLTFQPERLEDGSLYGRSEALGACTVSLHETDRLVLGSEIDKEVHTLPFGEWELVYAPDPAVLSEDGVPGSGPTPGTASELVGQPAPDIRLQRLDGSDFDLTELRGQVVVLDFWASWCGPCMQAMPQIEETVGALADQGVELVSVNLQESPEQIEAALERLGIAPTVVLDRDGAVAAHYQANAIPQTVVIDREGTIARLFVGAGPRFADQLRAAIEATLER